MNHRKKFAVMAGVCAMLAGFSLRGRAEDKKPELTQAQYLAQLQVKLDHAASRANAPTAEGSAVVGLRGAQQESASKQLYWKGKKGSEAVSPDEVKAFRSAVDQAQAGKTADAITALKAFQEKYPKSALLPDVRETLVRLSETPKP